jgi:uncharacterized protein with PhoU and TrkA domain
MDVSTTGDVGTTGNRKESNEEFLDVGAAQKVKKAVVYSEENFKKKEIIEYSKIQFFNNKKIKTSVLIKTIKLQMIDDEQCLYSTLKTLMEKKQYLASREIIDKNGIKPNSELIRNNVWLPSEKVVRIILIVRYSFFLLLTQRVHYTFYY